MARAIQLEKPPIIEELPEAEEVEETEVAAVSADIDPNMDIKTRNQNWIVTTVPGGELMYPVESKKKESEKTYLQQLTGKRVIILD